MQPWEYSSHTSPPNGFFNTQNQTTVSLRNPPAPMCLWYFQNEWFCSVEPFLLCFLAWWHLPILTYKDFFKWIELYQFHNWKHSRVLVLFRNSGAEGESIRFAKIFVGPTRKFSFFIVNWTFPWEGYLY